MLMKGDGQTDRLCVVVERPTGNWLATNWRLCLLFYYYTLRTSARRQQ